MKRFLAVILLLTLLLTGCGPIAELQVTTDATTAVTQATTEAPSQQATAPATEETTQASTEPVFDPYRIIDTMTVEELVGQMFLARCPSNSSALDHIDRYHLGGYILFARDFENETPDTLRQTLAGYQNASAIPMLLAVDEEGGSVTRVSYYPAFRESRFPSPRKLYEQGGMELIVHTEQEKCSLLTGLGINVNMAPVCDVTTDANSFMYSRSLGQSPEVTGQYIATVVDIMAYGSLGSVLKHFPGYGNNTDTHVGIANDQRSLAQLEESDLVPFRSGIQAGCDAILVSHTFVRCLDSELPASLSPAVIGYLRNEMGFEGVVVTDDLVMQAITDLYGAGESAVLAVLAGNDLLCSTEYAVQYEAVLAAVEDGRIPLERVTESVARLLTWKYRLGLLPVA